MTSHPSNYRRRHGDCGTGSGMNGGLAVRPDSGRDHRQQVHQPGVLRRHLSGQARGSRRNRRVARQVHLALDQSQLKQFLLQVKSPLVGADHGVSVIRSSNFFTRVQPE